MATEPRFRAVAYREGDVYVMQGIEYDITAHADDLPQLMDEFERAVAESRAITVHLGRAPLAGIKPAPQRFAEMFERADLQLSPVARRKGAGKGIGADLSVRYSEQLEAAQ